MTDVPEGQVYKGPCGVGRDSPWLTNEDLPHDRDVPVQIESVRIRRNVAMQGGREKRVALSLKFHSKDRELILNATCRKVLAALFGPDTAAWFGQRILLYVEQDVRRPDGTRGPAVRIRAKRVEAPPAATREPGGEG